ncbi:MAG: efflux RND transporter periplasmic adaptor subunit [Proteobacteria bacterium]|nr:efflux RND transporter periplasmic adaptor subunit [Pseudomonadota bacterium]
MINKITRLFLLLLFVFSISVNADDRAPAAIVQVEEAVNIEIAPFIWVSGTVIGRFDSRIAAEVEGNLVQILDVGDRVNKNDVIAKINDTTYRLALNEIEAEIMPIETMVAFYHREAERLEKLAMQNNAAKNLLDETQANRDEALARIRAVKAKLALANDDVNRTIVRAPFNGVITERFKMPGERVEAGDQIVRLINTEMLEIQARIQQASFEFINANDTLTIKGRTDEITGVVRAVIPVGDDVSRLYEIRVEFDKSNWPAGMAVKIAVPVKEKQRVIAVPRDALVIRQSGIVVYRVNGNNLAEVVPVKTGISNTTHIQVIGDISENDKIVIRGNERLRPGQTVQIIGGSSS